MIIIILSAILGAAIYRWRGSDHTFRPFSQMVFAMAFGLVTQTFYEPLPLWESLCIYTAVLIPTFAAVCTSHGGFQDLGTWTAPRSDERLEFIIKRLRGKIPEYWYDVLGLAVTGMAITLPCGIATLNPLIALSGALKGPAYMIGRVVWGMFPYDRKPMFATEIGEILTGAFLYGVLVAMVWGMK